jgi:hypothetical protein
MIRMYLRPKKNCSIDTYEYLYRNFIWTILMHVEGTCIAGFLNMMYGLQYKVQANWSCLLFFSCFLNRRQQCVPHMLPWVPHIHPIHSGHSEDAEVAVGVSIPIRERWIWTCSSSAFFTIRYVIQVAPWSGAWGFMDQKWTLMSSCY